MGSTGRTVLTALLALVAGFAGAALWSVSGLGHRQTHAYLVAHPDILPQMAEALERREAQKRLAGMEEIVAAPFAGAVLGNPNGSRVLVEFTDYACGYCRQSVAHVRTLIAADPQLKVVVREWPIFPGSEEAARMALAAARQGRFAAFHDAMFAAGKPTPQTVAQAAQAAGLDVPAAMAFARSDAATQEIARNMAFAERLGFTGTPSWIAGGQVIQGAVGPERLAAALRSQAE